MFRILFFYGYVNNLLNLSIILYYIHTYNIERNIHTYLLISYLYAMKIIKNVVCIFPAVSN